MDGTRLATFPPAMLLALSLLLSLLMLPVFHGQAQAARTQQPHVQVQAQAQAQMLDARSVQASPSAPTQARAGRDLAAACPARVAAVFVDELKPQGRPPLAEMLALSSPSRPAPQPPLPTADEQGKKPCWPPQLICIAADEPRVLPQSTQRVCSSFLQGPKLRPPCPPITG